MKYLIINADDFGMSNIFNEVILELLQNKQVRSTSVMVKRGNLEHIRELIRLHDKVSIGLHLEFATQHYATEAKAQLDKFISIFGSKPTHVDVHRSRQTIESQPFISVKNSVYLVET